MADPVIIDDGGSTRIKQVIINNPPTDSVMDGLLNPNHKDKPKGPFSSVRIEFIDVLGNLTTVGTFPLGFGPGGAPDTFEIFSGNNQRVKGRLVNAAGECELQVFGINGNDPNVEAKQGGAQRRYIVANAGSIERVKIGGTEQYNVSNTPTPAQLPVLYTMVILS